MTTPTEGDLVFQAAIDNFDRREQAAVRKRLIRGVNREKAFDEMLAALGAARHALRSYQYGNGAPDLAKETADYCEKVLKEAEQLK